MFKKWEINKKEEKHEDKLGKEKCEDKQKEEKAQQYSQNQPKREEHFRQFLAVCENCNQPIYKSEEIVRENGRVCCKACKQRQEARIYEATVASSKRRRTLSFILGPLPSLILFIAFMNWGNANIGLLFAFMGISIALFAFISCCILKNNFVGELVEIVFSWSFIKLPGLIFTLDVDGCLWFICTKILFAILGFAISVSCALLAIVIGSIVSLFVYPYAIIKNIKHPEKQTDL